MIKISNLPFGLCNAPGLMKFRETCLVYFDDIVCGKTFEEIVINLEEVFVRPGSCLETQS